MYGDHALLRSLAVSVDSRSDGIGARLVSEQERDLSDVGVIAVYLLTGTAEGYFKAHGYKSINRKDAPTSIRKTKQFSGVCPGSAVLMCKELKVPV